MQLDEIRRDVDGLVATERSIDNRRQRDADATARRNTVIRTAGFALLLLLVPLALMYLVRVVLRPVREVSRAATQLAGRARVVVVDVTGVPEIDSRVAQQLLATVAALRLLGTRVTMTGISGELAQALVGLDIDFHGVDSFADLQGGVEAASG